MGAYLDDATAKRLKVTCETWRSWGISFGGFAVIRRRGGRVVLFESQGPHNMTYTRARQGAFRKSTLKNNLGDPVVLPADEFDRRIMEAARRYGKADVIDLLASLDEG